MANHSCAPHDGERENAAAFTVRATAKLRPGVRHLPGGRVILAPKRDHGNHGAGRNGWLPPPVQHPANAAKLAAT